MFAEELKQLFFPFLEEVNFLFSRIFNKGVPISNEMTIFIFAVCIALLFIFIFSMWLLLRRKSQNEQELDQTSPKIKKKSLELLKKESDKENITRNTETIAVVFLVSYKNTTLEGVINAHSLTSIKRLS